jgi:hypothetical protein
MSRFLVAVLIFGVIWGFDVASLYIWLDLDRFPHAYVVQSIKISTQSYFRFLQFSLTTDDRIHVSRNVDRVSSFTCAL